MSDVHINEVGFYKLKGSGNYGSFRGTCGFLEVTKWMGGLPKLNMIQNNKGGLRESAVINDAYCFPPTGCASDSWTA